MKHSYITQKEDFNLPEPELTEAQKKRFSFSAMFTLHALLSRAGVQHENSGTLTCSGYIKTSNRF